jgi:hypothetical protein
MTCTLAYLAATLNFTDRGANKLLHLITESMRIDAHFIKNGVLRTFIQLRNDQSKLNCSLKNTLKRHASEMRLDASVVVLREVHVTMHASMYVCMGGVGGAGHRPL